MISFKERTKLGLEQLAKQPPVTLARARKQAQKLKIQSNTKNKKQRVLLLQTFELLDFNIIPIKV